jgi:hypothetical protein
MADIEESKQTDVIRINGRSEDYVVDSVQEDGINKLWVKSTIVPEAIGNLFFEHATDSGGSNQLAVDGSVTPVEFTVDADATDDLLISGLLFHAFDGGIKIDNFLGLNNSLQAGLVVEVKSEDVIFQFPPIKTTQQFDAHFSWGDGRSYELIFASGNDSMVARYGVSQPFLIKKQGTYATDDYIKVTVSDNISQVADLNFLVAGKKDT